MSIFFLFPSVAMLYSDLPLTTGLEERQRFVRLYLSSSGNILCLIMFKYELSLLGSWNDLLLFSQLWDLYAGNQPTENEVEQLVQDIENYTLASHLFWGLWGIISVLII